LNSDDFGAAAGGDEGEFSEGDETQREAKRWQPLSRQESRQCSWDLLNESYVDGYISSQHLDGNNWHDDDWAVQILKTDFYSRARYLRAKPLCCHCGCDAVFVDPTQPPALPDSALPAKPARVLLVGIDAHAEVDYPQFVCPNCARAVECNPMGLGLFPATPDKPQTFYTHELLKFTTLVILEADMRLMRQVANTNLFVPILPRAHSCRPPVSA